MFHPSRGEIWLVDLNPIKGHEQAGKRPALIVSTNYFNSGPAELVVVVPLTTTQTRIPLHVEIHPPEGGLDRESFIKCENIRSVAKERLLKKMGSVSDETISKVEERLVFLLDL